MKEKSKEITCVKCGTSMKRGYLVERDYTDIIPSGMGFYWIPMRRVWLFPSVQSSSMPANRFISGGTKIVIPTVAVNTPSMRYCRR